ncbi:MAG: fused MFS/spermidine synthase [Alphaproteobacteria bacterium]|jgi:spermidine synthase|nr:fused MFS/spermidine synthase [Alphaproteobacteria bacterium]MBT5390012.1 fused MFS/spermidine synthase [Alphaproteobacteria bacterium]MBT5540897.1 fused MFS/spermidine synthase [Alphaproteobacteria bacterium]MBT5654960.1 fused MFS/spermidine synthase [Alphaproteobacteria bacterium]
MKNRKNEGGLERYSCFVKYCFIVFTIVTTCFQLATASDTANPLACYQLSSQPKFNLKKADVIDVIQGKDISVYVLEVGPHIGMSFERKHDIQSMYNPLDSTELAMSYGRIMTLGVLYPTTKEIKKVLMIGLGGGRITSYLSQYMKNTHFTGVELSPEVIKVAQQYFDVKPSEKIKIVESEGWKFLKGSKEKFDLIFLDAYWKEILPEHLKGEAFYKEVKKHLVSGGAVVQNVFNKRYFLSEAEDVMTKLFDHVDIFERGHNFILIGYDGPLKTESEKVTLAETLQKKYDFRYNLKDLFECFFYESIPDAPRKN